MLVFYFASLSSSDSIRDTYLNFTANATESSSATAFFRTMCSALASTMSSGCT